MFCVNWRIILRTGLLSLIREVMQRDPALLVFTMSALRGQVPAHHVGPICSIKNTSFGPKSKYFVQTIVSELRYFWP